MTSNTIVLTFDADAIGQLVKPVRQADNIDEVRRISQAIARGEEIFRSYALVNGGNWVEGGGERGCLEIPAVALNDLDQVKVNYKSATNLTVSIGLGKTLTDSRKALAISKLDGSNKTTFWDKALQEKIDEAAKDPKSEEASKVEECLTKAVPVAGDSPRTEGSAGQGHRVHGASWPHHQLRDTNEVKEIEKVAGYVPPAVETSGMTQQFEEQFGQQADKQEQTEKVKALKSSSDIKQLKQQVAGSLEALRQQLPVISQLKQAYPDTYKSILGLVQSVIVLAQGLQEIDQTLQKSEGQRKRNWVGGGVSIPPLGTPARENWEKNFKSALAGYFSNGDMEALKPTAIKLSDVDQAHLVDEKHPRTILYARMQIGRDRVPPILVSKLENGKYHVLDGNRRLTAARMAGADELPAYERVPSLTKDMLATSEPVNTYDLGLFKAGLSEGFRLEDFDSDQLAIGTQKEMSEHRVDFEVARSIAMDHLATDPEYYSKEDEEETWNDGVPMDTRKEELEPDEAPPSKNSKVLDKKGLDKKGLEKVGLVPNLPVGTLKDGKRLVQHYDGGKSWVGVREGEVLGQDPSHHPVSSIRPGAR